MFGVGVVEVLLALIASAPGVLVVVLATRSRWAFAPVERPPIRWRPVLVATIATMLGAVVGLAIGLASFEPLLASLPLPAGSRLVVLRPTDFLVARFHVALGFAGALALPGVGALGSLLVTRDRSPRAAAMFSLFIALGTILGAALGIALMPHTMASLFAFADEMRPTGSTLEPVIMIRELAAFLARVVFSYGVIGAVLTGTAAAASRSAPAFRNALVLSCAVPGVAMFVSAPLTPPDVASQLLLAFPLGVAWGVGLLVAGGVRVLRRA